MQYEKKETRLQAYNTKIIFFISLAISSTLAGNDRNAVGLSLKNTSTQTLAKDAHQPPEDHTAQYLINFNNVSILEYIHFISKISGYNFIYDSAQLQFDVTIVSEKPLSLRDIMSALVQTLRINNLVLVEQENNLIITNAENIKHTTQIAPSNSKIGAKQCSPLITKVFQCTQGNLEDLASIIRSLTSTGSLVEVLKKSNQILVTDITTNIEKISQLIEQINQTQFPLEIKEYDAQSVSAQELVSYAEKIIQPFAENQYLSYVVKGDSNKVFIVGSTSLIERSLSIFKKLDQTTFKDSGLGKKLFMYKSRHRDIAELVSILEKVVQSIDQTSTQYKELSESLQNIQALPGEDALFLFSSEEMEKHLVEILNTFDLPGNDSSFFTYPAPGQHVQRIEAAIQQIAQGLEKNNSDLEIASILKNARYLDSIGYFLFTGPAAFLKQTESLVALCASAHNNKSNTYWVYSPQNLSGTELAQALNSVLSSLRKDKKEYSSIKLLQSVSVLPNSDIIIVIGNADAIREAKELAQTIDQKNVGTNKLLIYTPKYLSGVQLESALDSFVEKLEPNNPVDAQLIQAVDSLVWVQGGHTLLLQAPEHSLGYLEKIVLQFDNPEAAKRNVQDGYVLKKLNHVNGNTMLMHLGQVISKLPSSNPNAAELQQTLSKTTYLKDNNSLLITGSPPGIIALEELISQFDIPENHASAKGVNFFTYKPKHLSAQALRKTLVEAVQDLTTAKALDENVLDAVKNCTYIENTGSLIFKGPPNVLHEIQTLLPSIDTLNQTSMGSVTGATFLLYQLKALSLDEGLHLIQHIISGLEDNHTHHTPTLVSILKNAKPVPHNNAILFVGPPEELQEVEKLMQQVDTESTHVEPHYTHEEDSEENPYSWGEYSVYKPTNLSATELLEIMDDFQKNLSSSGMVNPDLFDAIESLKYIRKTGYILVSGTPMAVDQVIALLERFDLTGGDLHNMPESDHKDLLGSNITFATYKLRFHQGAEIQQALLGVSQELSKANSSPEIVKAIQSMQWIKLTNSLLATGPSSALLKLKDLIHSLDVPLRQVFIELLLIETKLNNNQSFGLEWGSRSLVLERLAGNVSHMPAPGFNQSIPKNLEKPLSEITASRTPVITDFAPTLGGFDLGVIGDIILHKGKSFLSLGSLVRAVEQDSDSIIIMNQKMITQDNRESTLFVGQNIPFAGSVVQTNGGASQQTTTNIEYRNVGTSLTVTPVLGSGDIVTLHITSDITKQIANTASGTANVYGVQTSRTTFSANVHVPNKHFVILSGVLDSEKDHFKSRVPCLGGIPSIGFLFSANDRSAQKNQVVFFLKPTIIDSVQDYEELSCQNQEQTKDAAHKPLLKEEIEDSILPLLPCEEDFSR